MKTCLVVDDSTVIRKIARGILEDLDFETVEAADGEKALEICRRGLPEAILLDWNMPVMDGYEFLVQLRCMLRWRRAQGGVLHHRKRHRPYRARFTPAPTNTS